MHKLCVLILFLAITSCGEVCETCSVSVNSQVIESDMSVTLNEIDDLSYSEKFCGDELEAFKYNEGTNSSGDYVVIISCE